VIYDGKRQECACESYLFFYDMDGAGNFTVIDSGRGVVESHNTGYLPSYIPEWAKNSAAPSTK